MSCARLRLDRVLFGLAGTLTIAGAVLAALVSPWFLVLPLFVGANQWLYAALGGCPASVLLSRTPCFAGKATL